uniref:Uncharacterized protein LOC102803850 n=1 Tax=Saccoglossus kowalevskii TaxID=10224 RepID=A0ABM0M7T3_SACKO|nr:PREDICTED: uncharacterized protein LOC102803850 [Saccoglossus kowalevskii]
MMQHNLSCLYVSMPPFARTMLTILKNANVPQVKTFADISTSEYPEIAKIKEGYVVSLLEQEICARSKVFLSTTHSSWSRIAEIPRTVHGEKTLTLETFVSWKSPIVALK